MPERLLRGREVLALSPAADVARALAGCWRPAPECELPALAPDVVAMLERGRCLSLARMERRLSVGPDDQARFRTLALRRLVRARELEHTLAEAADRLEQAGIRWALLKGWSAARAYAEPHRRPCGDLDLLVAPEDRERAGAVLAGLDGRPFPVDLVGTLRKLYGRSPSEMLERAVHAPLGTVSVPVLRVEDQLRHLALHLWKHSAWRPLWLCDVAAALEARPAAFDWDLCLFGTARAAEWVQAACLLAGDLLGAELGEAPLRDRQLPEWLVQTTLRHWETGPGDWCALAGPARFDPRRRCPDPIRAALRTGSPFGPEPRGVRAGLLALDLAASVLRRVAGPRRNWLDPVSR